MIDIVLHIQEKNITLQLCRGEEVIAQDEWVDNNDLLEEFFPRFDTMLKTNGFTVKDIAESTLKTDLPTGYTTTRIATTIIKTLGFITKNE